MSSYTPLGRLQQAPLVYTLGVVLISLKNLGEYIDQLQDALRDDYPSYLRMDIDVGRQDPVQPTRLIMEKSPNHVLNNPDRTWGVVLTPERLALQTVAYQDFPDFSRRFSVVLAAFLKVTNLKYHSGLAFRQIDNIFPIEGEGGLRDCVDERHLPPEWPLATDQTFNRQESMARHGSTQVMARTYAFLNVPGPSVPQDLFPFYWGLFDSQATPDQAIKPVVPPFILADFEAAETYGGRSEPFDPAVVMDKMDMLHRHTSLAFRQAMQEDAVKRRR